MGHYDNCRPDYCGACGAGPGNIVNGICEICHPPKRKSPNKYKPPHIAAVQNLIDRKQPPKSEIELLRDRVKELEEANTKWRAFARECQRTVAAIKTFMTPEQVVEYLGSEIDRKINALATNDTPELDPDLVETVRKALEERNDAD